jgi:L-lactate dehydrogenase complex protein LldG
MTSRESILDTLRRQTVPATELPPLEQNWIRYDDPRAQFGEVLASVGGEAVSVPSLQHLTLDLAQRESFRNAKRIFSSLPEVWQANVDADQIESPHELADLDFAIVRGELAVAENGAVWVTDERLRHRAVLFLPRHLAIVVPAQQLVHHLHEAYHRISFVKRSFGLFISGPSKTADIEQSLVIGAHGPQSLTVYLLEGEG